MIKRYINITYDILCCEVGQRSDMLYNSNPILYNCNSISSLLRNISILWSDGGFLWRFFSPLSWNRPWISCKSVSMACSAVWNPGITKSKIHCWTVTHLCIDISTLPYMGWSLSHTLLMCSSRKLNNIMFC